MRIENKRMMAFLRHYGIRAKARYTPTGSMKGTWNIWDLETKWEPGIRAMFGALGFMDYDGQPLKEWSGNGGRLSLSVRGHNELLTTDPLEMLLPKDPPEPLINVLLEDTRPPAETDETLMAKHEEIRTARDMWAAAIKEQLEKEGDTGTCVLGASISISYLPPKARNRVDRELISVHQVCSAQGSITWERSVDQVIAYLKGAGIPSAYYNCGRMD